MIMLILCISLLVVLATVGVDKLQSWKSSRHMINAEWLDDSEKFNLVSRWGVMG